MPGKTNTLSRQILTSGLDQVADASIQPVCRVCPLTLTDASDRLLMPAAAAERRCPPALGPARQERPGGWLVSSILKKAANEDKAIKKYD